MEDMVSVIISVYNGERCIKSCLESLLAQIYDNIEIIVVDDGSTDNTYTILRHEFGETDKITILKKSNGGVSSARNLGIDSAKGKYIVFVDADDRVSENYIYDMLHSMKKNNSELVICGYSTINDNNEISNIYDFNEETVSSAEAVRRTLLYRNINSALWNKFFSLDIIRKYGLRFDEQIAIGEDMLFLTEYCCKIEKCSIIPKRLYYYYMNPAGAMSGKNRGFNERQLTEWYAIIKAEKILNDNGLRLKEIRIKKMRIADKLLSRMERSDFKNEKIKREFVHYLRKNFTLIFKTSDFSKKKKISIILNCFFPTIFNAVKRW